MAKKSDTVEMQAANLEAITAAVAAGQAIIQAGKPKIEAAMHIYGLLESESQEIVVAAFIEGAALTPKGALTYWYNCKRKVAKAKLLNRG